MSTATDATALLKLIAARYAGMTTYSDRGTVALSLHSGDGALTLLRPFTTAFLRPRRFRFEFTEHHPNQPLTRYIVSQDGTSVRTYWTRGHRVEAPSSLGLALAGATGVSGGSAHTIPALLLPALFEESWRLTDLENPQLRDPATIVGNGHRGRLFTVTIDPASLLVLSIEEGDSALSSGTASQVTTYDPQADLPLDDKLLAAAFPSPEA